MLDKTLLVMATQMAHNGYQVLINEARARVTVYHRSGSGFSLLPQSAQNVINSLRHYRLNTQLLNSNEMQLAAVKPAVDQIITDMDYQRANRY